MALLRLLRALCPHRWIKIGEEHRGYGMGLERFEIFRCRWCGDEGDQFPDKSGHYGGSHKFMNHGQPN